MYRRIVFNQYSVIEISVPKNILSNEKKTNAIFFKIVFIRIQSKERTLKKCKYDFDLSNFCPIARKSTKLIKMMWKCAYFQI